MTNRVKLWLGASALALTSGALPAAAILSPITIGALSIGLAGEAWAQASSNESGGGGAEADCAATEDGEGDDDGTTECPSSDDASSSGEDGEG